MAGWMAHDRQVSVDELLGHAEWLQRLARHLAGDAGDDLAQDVWLAAHRSPPEAGRPARPWLAQVLRNLARTRRRDGTRRARREQDYQHSAPERAAAVDEVYERVELHRFLVDRVMALDEPLRTVVILRYFEGLDSARIAELTGAPAGTVRWRLKQALERLRATLDARHGGERRAWVAILVPAASRGGGAANTGALIMASAKSNTLLAALVLALLAVSGGALWWRHTRQAPGETSLRPGGDPPAGRPQPGPGAMASSRGRAGELEGKPGEPAAATELAGCRRALGQARDEADARDRGARAVVPEVAFEAGGPNARLRDEVLPQVERLLAGAGTNQSLVHDVECHGWACRLTLLVPALDSNEVGPRLEAMKAWVPQVMGLRQLTITPRSPLGVTMQWGGTNPSEDSVAHRKLDRYVFYFGAPPTAPEPRGAPALPEPASLEDCQSQLASARELLRRRLAQLAGFRPAFAIFDDGADAPALTARVQAAADRALGTPGEARAECKDSVCRLRFAHPPEAAALARLRAEDGLEGRILKELRFDGALYLTIGEDGWTALTHQRAPMRAAAFYAGCPQPEREGNVLLRILVPETGASNEDGAFGHASVRLLGGTLAGTPAASCLTGRMAALLSRQELPSPVGSLHRFESWDWRPGQPPRPTTPPAW
jgi:RNA polymerase sigma-70 factor (ECF subfamily)